MKLSQAFIEEDVPITLDLSVRVININYDKSSEVLERSKTLRDYSYFIYQVKCYKKEGFSLEESIEKAIKDCIQQDRLKTFLTEHGSEVINMLYTEFDLDTAKEVWMEEAEKRGKEEGKREAKRSIAISLLDVLDLETIEKKTGLTIEELKVLKEEETPPK